MQSVYCLHLRNVHLIARVHRCVFRISPDQSGSTPHAATQTGAIPDQVHDGGQHMQTDQADHHARGDLVHFFQPFVEIMHFRNRRGNADHAEDFDNAANQ
jgi:hypothetical protein